MKNNYLHRTKKTTGMALLIAIIIATLVISIGIALSSVAVKELTLSSTLTGSEAAYYSSKTGADCAKYFILNSTEFDGGANQHVTCNGTAADITTDDNGVESFDFVMKTGTVDVPYTVHVDVTKDNSGVYKITSHGFNVDENGNRRVERVVTATVTKSSFCVLPSDLMIALDLSGSIDDQQLADTKTAIEHFIDTVDPSVDIGILTFSGDGEVVHPLDSDHATAKQTVDHLSAPSGSTNLDSGIQVAVGAFTENDNNNDRADAPNILLIVSDGIPTKTVSGPSRPTNDSQEYIEQAMDITNDSATTAKQAGVEIFTIGIMDGDPTPHYESDNDYVPPVQTTSSCSDCHGRSGDPSDEPPYEGRKDFMVGISNGPDNYLQADDLSHLSEALTSLNAKCNQGPPTPPGGPGDPGGGGGETAMCTDGNLDPGASDPWADCPQTVNITIDGFDQISGPPSTQCNGTFTLQKARWYAGSISNDPAIAYGYRAETPGADPTYDGGGQTTSYGCDGGSITLEPSPNSGGQCTYGWDMGYNFNGQSNYIAYNSWNHPTQYTWSDTYSCPQAGTYTNENDIQTATCTGGYDQDHDCLGYTYTDHYPTMKISY